MHEDILRLLTHEHGAGDDSDDDELDTTAALLKREGVSVSGSSNGKEDHSLDEEEIDPSATALKHLKLLKLAYERLGSWPKPYDEYKHLNAQVFRAFAGDAKWKGVEGTEKWDAKGFGNGKAESGEGEFGGVKEWGLGKDEVILRAQEKQ